ncbi:methionine--tRNA ligase [Patescibacteria group bacterium]|nr:methionine--tRNA ligase [Patescibacteria group bacterium]MBU2036226.1 methionine--tRNA ligase [Patescibacteria group bacterium]
MNKKFYITCAIPYVNSLPHIGHALEFVQGDTIARYHRLLDKDVLLLSGGDENALKNVQAAEEINKPIQEFVDENTQAFFNLTEKLNCQFDIWQKGSDQKKHFPSVQKLWNLCLKNGDIYKGKYEGLYCLGCEAYYLKDELDQNGECFEHPGKKLQKVSEENYFFKLSKYQKELIELIKSDKLKIIPDFRKNEVLSFLKEPLRDISISRSNERAKNWGVPVPNDPTQRIYVWFDALNIYQSGIGFGWDEKKYKKYWPADVHVIGKGISRFHSIYWPAFLLSAKLSLPKTIFIHGYLTINGQKISKTVGNVIDPTPLIKKYGTDAIRYYLLAKVSPFKDGDFSEEKLINSYNSDLANGLGNLIARISKLAEKDNLEFDLNPKGYGITKNVISFLNDFKLDEGINTIFTKLRNIDKEINKKEPWKLSNKDLKNVLFPWIEEIRIVSQELKIFLPETAEKIEKQFLITKIKSTKPLFPRI